MPAVAAVVAVVSSIGAGAAAVVGVAGLTGITAAVVGGAVIGAVTGGVIAAVKGENILKGALKGGLIGGALGGVAAWAAPALAPALAPTAAAAETGITGVAVTGAAETVAGMELAAVTGEVAGVTAAAGEVAGVTAAAGEVAGVTAATKAAIGTMTTAEKLLAVGTIGAGVMKELGPSEEDIIAAEGRRDVEEFERTRRKIQPGVQIPQDQMRIAGAGPVSIERPGWVDELSAQPLPAVRPMVPLEPGGTVAPQHYASARGLLGGGVNA